MATLTAVVAGVCVVIGGLVLSAAMVFGIYLLWASIVDPIRLRWRQEGYDIAINRINQNAYWFSEDPPTMNLLRAFGRDGLDMWKVRDAWNRERAAFRDTETRR